MKTQIRSRALRAVMQSIFDFTWNHYVLQRHTRTSTKAHEATVVNPLFRLVNQLWDATTTPSLAEGNRGTLITPPLPRLRRDLANIAEEFGLTIPAHERAADRRRRLLASSDPVTRSLAAVDAA
jgi:hypothetical protein